MLSLSAIGHTCYRGRGRTYSRLSSICLRRCFKAFFRASSLTVAMLVGNWRSGLASWADFQTSRSARFLNNSCHVPDLSSSQKPLPCGGRISIMCLDPPPLPCLLCIWTLKTLLAFTKSNTELEQVWHQT